MRLLVAVLSFVFTVQAFGFEAEVLEVVHGPDAFAKLSNGEVKFLDGKAMLRVGDRVQTESGGFDLSTSTFKPTVLSSQAEAKDIFDHMRPASGWSWNSQCYNRAHVWVWEEFNRTGRKMMKSFLFFTNKYIREYRFKWWFHVAPFTIVEEQGEKKEMVVDLEFMEEPLSMKEWTDHFVKTKNVCPSVTKYTDYEDHQQEQDCYLIKTSMYFWTPDDIEAFEKTGEEKKEFIPWEIKKAYKNSF